MSQEAISNTWKKYLETFILQLILNSPFDRIQYLLMLDGTDCAFIPKIEGTSLKSVVIQVDKNQGSFGFYRGALAFQIPIFIRTELLSYLMSKKILPTKPSKQSSVEIIRWIFTHVCFDLLTSAVLIPFTTVGITLMMDSSPTPEIKNLTQIGLLLSKIGGVQGLFKGFWFQFLVNFVSETLPKFLIFFKFIFEGKKKVGKTKAKDKKQQEKKEEDSEDVASGSAAMGSFVIYVISSYLLEGMKFRTILGVPGIELVPENGVIYFYRGILVSIIGMIVGSIVKLLWALVKQVVIDIFFGDDSAEDEQDADKKEK